MNEKLDIPQDVAREMLIDLINEERDCERDSSDSPCMRSRLICRALKVTPAVGVMPAELEGEIAPTVLAAMNERNL